MTSPASALPPRRPPLPATKEGQHMPIFWDTVALHADLAAVIGGRVHATDSQEEAARSLAQDPAETLVVIGPDTATEDALAFCARLQQERPAVGVVLIRSRADVTLLSRA